MSAVPETTSDYEESPEQEAPKDEAAPAKPKGRTLKRVLFGYTTCPGCAKVYGHNYVVLFAEVEPLPS